MLKLSASQTSSSSDTLYRSNVGKIVDTKPAEWPYKIRQAKIMPYKVAEEEADVGEALNANVLKVLSTTIGSNQIPKEPFRRYSVFEKLQGKPGFILVDGNHPILAIEVKTKWVL